MAILTVDNVEITLTAIEDNNQEKFTLTGSYNSTKVFVFKKNEDTGYNGHAKIQIEIVKTDKVLSKATPQTVNKHFSGHTNNNVWVWADSSLTLDTNTGLDIVVQPSTGTE